MKSLILTALPLVAAWPQVMDMNERMQKRDTEPAPRAPLFLSGRPNTSLPPAGFSAAEQYVDVTTGSGHEFVAPGSKDRRGQCPGLNAAANHGFLPHSGIVTTEQTITGLGDAYNMSPDLALALAVISIGLAGDPVAGTWSIGGAFPVTLAVAGEHASGIVGTHNQYESDASIVRGDAYLNGGNVGVFQMRSWNHLWGLANSQGEYTLDIIAAQSDYVTRYGKENNPYFFQAPFAGAVSAAAHNFVINFMSNRSAENPGGVLNREVLKSFFSVTGDAPGSFVHNPGHEQIPFNWYKRPAANAYNLANVVVDLLTNNGMYPGIFGVGGNTGTVNSFTGVDFSDLTGGVFNAATLGEGNNAACFFLQASMAGLPDAVDPLLGAARSILGWVESQLGPLMSKLQCPQLASFDNQLFAPFPGASYKGQGQSK